MKTNRTDKEIEAIAFDMLNTIITLLEDQEQVDITYSIKKQNSFK